MLLPVTRWLFSGVGASQRKAFLSKAKRVRVQMGENKNGAYFRSMLLYTAATTKAVGRGTPTSPLRINRITSTVQLHSSLDHVDIDLVVEFHRLDNRARFGQPSTPSRHVFLPYLSRSAALHPPTPLHLPTFLQGLAPHPMMYVVYRRPASKEQKNKQQKLG